MQIARHRGFLGQDALGPLARFLRDGDEESLGRITDTERLGDVPVAIDGVFLVVLGRVLYVKRYAREARVGFGSSS